MVSFIKNEINLIKQNIHVTNGKTFVNALKLKKSLNKRMGNACMGIVISAPLFLGFCAATSLKLIPKHIGVALSAISGLVGIISLELFKKYSSRIKKNQIPTTAYQNPDIQKFFEEKFIKKARKCHSAQEVKAKYQEIRKETQSSTLMNRISVSSSGFVNDIKFQTPLDYDDAVDYLDLFFEKGFEVQMKSINNTSKLEYIKFVLDFVDRTLTKNNSKLNNALTVQIFRFNFTDNCELPPSIPNHNLRLSCNCDTQQLTISNLTDQEELTELEALTKPLESKLGITIKLEKYDPNEQDDFEKMFNS